MVDVMIADPATARYATPVFIGEYPSTCCMYSVSIRNIENDTVPRISPEMFAAATVRIRKIENGISGSFTRASQTAKAARSTAASENRPMVATEPQPYWFACVIV